jgi:hypothetical protein
LRAARAPLAAVQARIARAIAHASARAMILSQLAEKWQGGAQSILRGTI